MSYSGSITFSCLQFKLLGRNAVYIYGIKDIVRKFAVGEAARRTGDLREVK